MATGLQVAEPMPPAHWDADAAKFYEVVDGRIVENPPMGARQSILASFLQILIGSSTISNRIGWLVTETLFVIDRARDLKRRPDLAFVSAQRWPMTRSVPEPEGWDVVPDLVAEFISKSNSADEVLNKINEYFTAGVTIVWVVYTSAKMVYVYESPTSVRILGLGDELEGGTVIPGFRVSVATLFEYIGDQATAAD
jgi:Uma2 family endonuclease